ncbi:transporter substrate-binding domain-containing protein [Sinorhizobium meliloti]|uniref:transporter substrate-binding domain-containing protein n=1 Tax=Rhizobium meliloti TaxID=382 RepID=UPI0003098DA9|nr:transporter substrate-binding domain-containing protein [Sinorhizobium meliloti]
MNAMKNWQTSLTGLITAVLLSAAPANADTLRVGMECTYAPFNYRTSDGKLEGYDVDVAKGISEIIGVDFEYVCQEWDGMIPALLANKFDLIIASMSITDKRKEQIDFSSPYRNSVGRIVGPGRQGFEAFRRQGPTGRRKFRWTSDRGRARLDLLRMVLGQAAESRPGVVR